MKLCHVGEKSEHLVLTNNEVKEAVAFWLEKKQGLIVSPEDMNYIISSQSGNPFGMACDKLVCNRKLQDMRNKALVEV